MTAMGGLETVTCESVSDKDGITVFCTVPIDLGLDRICYLEPALPEIVRNGESNQTVFDPLSV